MLASIYAELGASSRDIAGMAMLAEVAGKNDDPRAMLLLGSGGLGRGLPLDYYAYPTYGLPDYKPITIRLSGRWSIRSPDRKATSISRSSRRRTLMASCR